MQFVIKKYPVALLGHRDDILIFSDGSPDIQQELVISILYTYMYVIC